MAAIAAATTARAPTTEPAITPPRFLCDGDCNVFATVDAVGLDGNELEVDELEADELDCCEVEDAGPELEELVVSDVV